MITCLMDPTNGHPHMVRSFEVVSNPESAVICGLATIDLDGWTAEVPVLLMPEPDCTVMCSSDWQANDSEDVRRGNLRYIRFVRTDADYPAEG